MYELAIIGGGAAGLAAAVAASEQARAAGVDVHVAVFEAADKVGRSILASGNGRCNFSNAGIDVDAYRNAGFVRLAFEALPPSDVLEFFSASGLVWREEGQGRLFPMTLKASTVLDVLRARLASYEVDVHCECPIARIEAPREAGGRFTLVGKDGAFHRVDVVIVACGGKAGVDMLPAGLEIVEQRPILGAMRVADAESIIALDNIRVRATVSVLDAQTAQVKAEEQGEVLFRKYGVSGIAVFNLSRFAQPGDVLHIDFLADAGIDDLPGYLERRAYRLRQMGAAKTVAELLRGMLLSRVADAVLQQAELRGDTPTADLLPVDYAALADVLTGFALEVAAVGVANTSQVSRGGLAVDQLDAQTMQVTSVPGLYVVGELADVDGPCGGYNLHWAWTSGILAGRSAVHGMELVR